MGKRMRLMITPLLVLLLALQPPGPTLAQEQEPQIHITQVDSSNFPEVTVYVSVTDAAGEPVGVDPALIQLFENGQLVQPADFGGMGEIGPLTTFLVLDISGSMNMGGKLAGAKNAARAYIEQMRPGDQAGLIAFNTRVTEVQAPTSDQAALLAAVDSLRAEDDTAMYDALSYAVERLQHVPGRKAIIVLTDGLDNRSQAALEDVITAIGPAGLSISAIGLGDPNAAGNNFGLDEPALRSLADRAGGVYSFATDPNALAGLYELYARALQSEYRITYTSPSTLRDGINRTLTVSLADGAAAAQDSYNPGGVLPEVPPARSWTLFGGLLAGLLALLLLPALAGWGFQALGRSGRKGRINLSPSDKEARKQKPRVKLK
jgi:Ca-activated chloride channel homolog